MLDTKGGSSQSVRKDKPVCGATGLLIVHPLIIDSLISGTIPL